MAESAELGGNFLNLLRSRLTEIIAWSGKLLEFNFVTRSIISSSSSEQISK